jgi:uncharacterized iron-regulated membrane protein
MSLRKFIFWLHLGAGCIAGTIILLMSVTGVLLTYEKQILAAVERGPHRTEAPPASPRLPAGALVASVQQQRGDLGGNATLTLRSDPHEPAEIRISRERAIFVNPYTGKVLADETSGAVRVFFQRVVAWHRWLGTEGNGRTTARAITGACNLAFLFIVLSGAYLWLPRRWSWSTLRPILWFRRGAGGKARDFNWHNVFGVWALVPLAFVIATALPISYTWATNLLYRITGTEPPAAPAKSASAPVPGGIEQTGALDLLWSRAEQQVPGWKSITARVAVSGEPLAFTIDQGTAGQPQHRSTLTLDPSTGSTVRFETFADANAGRRWRMWSRFVHTGEYYGIVGQTIAGVASFAGVMLVWTGMALTFRRFVAWRNRRGRIRTQEEAEEVPVTVDAA